MWVMVSGIKSVKDAVNAFNLGVNAFGLVVEKKRDFESRFRSLEVATSITKSLSSIAENSPFLEMQKQLGKMESLCGSVLVTHTTDVQHILHLIGMIGVKIIQLVGDTTPEDILEIKNRLPHMKVIKTLPVIDYGCMREVKKYRYIVDAIELDTFDNATRRIGGTGKAHDWNISKEIVQEYGWEVPIILAGGLHAGNIEKAVQMVKPEGVDVSSGIKNREGVQDSGRLEMFLCSARQSENGSNRETGNS